MNALQDQINWYILPLLIRGVRGAEPSSNNKDQAWCHFASCPLCHSGGSELRVSIDREPEYRCRTCSGNKTIRDLFARLHIPWNEPTRPLDLRPFAEWEKAITVKRRPIVEGWYGECDVANLFASSKLGKTNWIAQQAVSIAAGIEFLGRKTYLPDGKQILVLDYELHPDTLKDRINTIIDAMGAPPSVKELIVYHSMRGTEFRRIDAVCQWLQTEPSRFAVVAFDSLYRALPVGMSENDNREFTEIYNLLAITADAHGCAFVLPGHSSKGDQSKRKSIDVGSGAGAQGRACDAHIVLREHPRCHGLVQMTVDVRSFQACPPVALQFEWPLWSVVEEPQPEPKPIFTTGDLLAMVPAEPIKRDDFIRQVFTENRDKTKKCDVILLLDKAISDGLVQVIPAKGNRACQVYRTTAA